MPDLAVPHLPDGEPHVVLRGADQRVGRGLIDAVEVRRAGHPDGISILVGALAVAIEDDQNHAGGVLIAEL